MRITKIKGLLILITSLLITLTACSSSTNDSGSSGEADSNDTFTLKLNDIFPQTKYDYEPRNFATHIFSERVEEATDGRVKIEVYNSSQLVPAGELMDALSSGTVDLGTTGSHLYGDLIPASHAINLPFWTNDEESAMELMNSEYGDIYKQKFEEYGVKVLVPYPTSNQIIMSKEPITSLEDMKGKQFRIESGLWTPWYEEIGVAPVKVDSAEIYSALQLGTIDGLFYADYTLDTANYHEVVDYITDPGIVPAIMNMTTISLKTWNKLPTDLQEIITEVAEEVQVEAVEASKKMTELSIKTANENGIKIHRFSDEELDKFKDSSQVIWDGVEAISEDTSKMINILREQ